LPISGFVGMGFTFRRFFMAGYVCKICGETATSKCAASRNVFPSNSTGALLSHFLSLKTVKEYDDGAKKVQVTLEFMSNPYYKKYDTLAEEAKEMLAQAVNNFSTSEWKSALCPHKWVLTSESCDLDCCHKQ